MIFDIFFFCLLTICISCVENGLLRSFIHFKIGGLSLCWHTLDNVSSYLMCKYFNSMGYIFTFWIVSFDAKIFNFEEIQFPFSLLVLCCQIYKTVAKSKIIKIYPHVLLEHLTVIPSYLWRVDSRTLGHTKICTVFAYNLGTSSYML